MAIITINPTRGAARNPLTVAAQIAIGALTSPLALISEARGGNAENYRVPARRNLAAFLRNDGEDPAIFRIPSVRRADGVFLRERVFTVPANGKIYGVMLDPAYAGNALQIPDGLTNLLPAVPAGEAITAREILISNGAFQEVTAGVPDSWTIAQPDPTGGANQGEITFEEGEASDENRFEFLQPSTPSEEGYIEADSSPWADLEAAGVIVEISRFYFSPVASDKEQMRIAWAETPGDVVFEKAIETGGGDVTQDGASILFPIGNLARLQGVEGTFGAADFFRLGRPSGAYPKVVSIAQVWRETEIANYATRWTLDTEAALPAGFWNWYRLSLSMGLAQGDGDGWQVRIELRQADTDLLCYVVRDHFYEGNPLAPIDIEVDFADGVNNESIAGHPLRLVVEAQKVPAEGSTRGASLYSANLTRLYELQTPGPDHILFQCESEDCQISIVDLDANPGAFERAFA